MASASSFFLVSLFSLLLWLPPIIAEDKDWIQETCLKTQYPDLCLSTIKVDRSSNFLNIRDLALIVIQKAEAIAESTSAFLLNSLLKNGMGPASHSVFRLCANKYGYASHVLQGSLKYLAANKFNFAEMELSAAKKYPKTCGCAFRARGLSHPPTLIKREELVERLCDIAFEIIKLLA